MSVSFEIHDGIALALVDRPPVNAIDATVRAGLMDAARRAAEISAVGALVIACRGRTFMSGADLAELGGVIPPPSYADVLSALENCPKPVIASLHGTALGGGLEIAMACHYRCATAGARMGMPEITLGILPGAGGTQRLPRLVGTLHALDMLISGAPIDAARAKGLGLIDEIAGEDPIVAGLDYARRLLKSGAGPRPTRALAGRATPLDKEAIAGVLDRHARSLKGRTTQDIVIQAIRASANTDFEAGLKLEAALSAESLRSAESLALRHVFFAERECGRVPGLAAAGTREIRKAVVVGAGTMGTGIAMALADAGIETSLVERDAPALARDSRTSAPTTTAPCSAGDSMPRPPKRASAGSAVHSNLVSPATPTSPSKPYSKTSISSVRCSRASIRFCRSTPFSPRTPRACRWACSPIPPAARTG